MEVEPERVDLAAAQQEALAPLAQRARVVRSDLAHVVHHQVREERRAAVVIASSDGSIPPGKMCLRIQSR